MGLFQRNANEGGRLAAPPGEPRATLAVFGKHPGWDDHLPGLGIETEVIARLKQVFYIAGIGGQIDSGAWEKLEVGKRLEGFDHTFLWFIGGHVVVGELWSSTDRKGRAKYPMVVCADCEGMPPETVLVKVRPELDRLRAACKAATTAEQVTADWNSARQIVRSFAVRPSQPPFGPVPGVDVRRRFLESAALGPDKLGLLRILHELAGALGSGGTSHTPKHGTTVDLHPHHLRVPLCSESRNEALLLWTGFLDGALPAGAPLLLIVRGGADSLDVVIGEPASDDLFCLQAAPAALPLATAIPYELAPELEPRLQVIEGKFLLADATPAPMPKLSLKSPPPSTPAPRAPSAPKPSAPPKAPGGGGKGWIFGLCGVLAVGAAAGAWYFMRGPDDSSTLAKPPGVTSQTPVTATTQPPSNTQAPAADGYVAAMTAGRLAFQRKDYDTALAQAKQAQAIRPGDVEASRLRMDADNARQDIAVRAAADAKYNQAMTAARAAFDQKDYAGAVAGAEAVLAMRPADAAAAKLKADAQAAIQEIAARADQAAKDKQAMAAAGDADAKYRAAMTAAQAAFDAKDFATATNQADVALGIKPGDAAAAKLKADAQARLTEVGGTATQETRYNDVMLAGKAALKRQEFAYAMTQANTALAIRPDDPDALRLKADIGRGEKYKDAMEAGQAALDRKDYAAAITQANIALSLQSNDTLATKLKSDAELAAQAERDAKYKQAMEAGLAALAAKKYDDAKRFATVALGIKPNDTEALKLKAAAQSPALTVDECDVVLRNLMIETRVKPAGPQVLTNGGTATAKSDAVLSSQQSHYLKQIEDLEVAYRSLKALDTERQKDLKKIKDAIPY